MDYFLVVSSPDGIGIYRVPKSRLEEVISEEYMGVQVNRSVTKEYLDSQTDPGYWPEGSYLLIKGEIVNPFPKTVIEKWEFP